MMRSNISSELWFFVFFWTVTQFQHMKIKLLVFFGASQRFSMFLLIVIELAMFCIILASGACQGEPELILGDPTEALGLGLGAGQFCNDLILIQKRLKTRLGGCWPIL